MQGGPHNGTIAGITQALFEADTKSFKDYSGKIIENAHFFAEELKKYGFKLVSGGTDKHLILIDLTNKGVGGKFAARALAYAGIVSNMNTIPYEKGSPVNPSGLRLGTPSITTRGMGEEEIKMIAKWINDIIGFIVNSRLKDLKFAEFNEKVQDLKIIKDIREEVIKLCKKFPFKV